MNTTPSMTPQTSILETEFLSDKRHKRQSSRRQTFIITALILAVLCSAWVVFRQFIYPASNASMAMAAGQYALAGTYYDQAAQTGDVSAQNALGNLHYLGLGRPQDFAAAADLYFAAASKNNAAAQLNLANLFRQGLGVGMDPMRAFGWYRMSDINGNPRAEYYMSQLALEFTLSPLQISAANEKFAKLDALIEAGL